MVDSGYFIQKAIKKKGALRDYVKNTFGKSGFNNDGTIKIGIINNLAKGVCPICFKRKCICPDKLTRQRARLAKTLRKLRIGSKSFVME